MLCPMLVRVVIDSNISGERRDIGQQAEADYSFPSSGQASPIHITDDGLSEEVEDALAAPPNNATG